MEHKAWNPNSPEVKAAIVERIRQLTPDEAMDFLEAGAEGLEQTNMTGHFPICPSRPSQHKEYRQEPQPQLVKTETAA